MRRFAFGLTLLLSLQASAGIYKTYDKNGNPVFTDSPSGDSESVQTRETMVVPALPVEIIRQKTRSQAPSAKDREEKEPETYLLQIVRPQPEETIPHGEESYPLEISLEPGLWQSHHLEVWLDGTLLARDNYSPELDPMTLDRGLHRLEVRVLNGQGEVLKSLGRDFYVQHASVLNKRKPAKSK